MIRKHAGQVLVAGFDSQAPPQSLLQQALAGHLGGMILFRRNVADLAQLVDLNRRLQSVFADDAPPFLALDQEGGRVARLGPPVLQLPPMRTLAALDDPALTRQAAHVLSQQLRALGFNLNLAPVLDVDTNPENPIIGDRSFGATVETVVVHARAMAWGMAEAGLGSCGKHFPGHGDTSLDSHLTRPRVAHELSRLQRVELAPFAALAAELPALMTAHVVFDALDREHPATLSARIATDLLRSSLHYGGVLISDDMDMRAITDYMDPGAAACAAIEAGCDTLLAGSTLEGVQASYEALVHRAERNTVFAARLAEAADRSLSMRRRFRAEVTAVADPGPQFEAQSAELQARLE